MALRRLGSKLSVNDPLSRKFANHQENHDRNKMEPAAGQGGTDPSAIEDAIQKLRESPPTTTRQPALWDGGAATRIVDILERDLGNS